jgi:hypothetical protein
MKPKPKTKAIEDFLEESSKSLYGSSRLDCIKHNTCVKCAANAKRFRDTSSLEEFAISGYCQTCQDSIFGK